MFKAVNLSRTIFSLVIIVAGLSATVLADDAAPGWLRQAATIQPPAYDKTVNAVVLQNEETVTLDSSGKLVTTDNYAVKILTREGKEEAVAVAFYLVNFGKVRDMQAWIIRPDGTSKTYGKKEIVDHISDPDDVYNEGRVKIINAIGDVDTGYVFGYSVTTEDSPLFYQDRWNFQRDLPTLMSRYTLNLPAGWKATSVTFNYPEVKPRVAGSSYTWEVRDLPAIKDEPLSPSFINIAPRMALSYGPEDTSQSVNKAFTNWTDVSKWGSSLHEPQVIVDDAVAIKARDLTANAKTELEKIQAIGKFVQNLQYISIDIGVGYGNGMKPRPSTMVLGRGYGDCKDKANLMRALLKSLKIEAYPVAIYSGDPNFVRKEWASPGQFNHCIIAVRVSDGTVVPTVITDAKLGRLMIFDATDPYTPVGDLPDYLQGSMALIMAGENGGLVQMPVTPAAFNAWNRNTEVSLLEDGSITGTISERTTGQSSANARRLFRSLSGSDYNQVIERWLTRGATAAQLLKLTPNDKQIDAGFDLDMEFSAPRYGQVMQDRLMVFKPVIASRTSSIYLTEKTRSHPVMLESESFTETATFKLPVGFVVDEMPDAVNLSTNFGKYSTKYEVKNGKLLFTRVLIMTRTSVPVDKYNEVRDFYSKMMDAEQAPVVLLRK
jgi:hypothetical protein